MNKLVITKWSGQILTMTQNSGMNVQLDLEADDRQSFLGNIYIGKVKNIVRNINAAFVEIGEGQMGYFPLTDAWIHRTNAKGDCSGKALRPGDEILVQVERDAVKTKAPVLTGNLNFPGRYFVLTAGKKQLGFSTKLHDQVWKQRMRELLEDIKPAAAGLIVRTNAYEASEEELWKELDALIKQYKTVMEAADHRTSLSLLYQSFPSYLAGIRDSFGASLEQIITDDDTVFRTIKEYLTLHRPEELPKLMYYQDPLLPLSKLYQVEKTMEEALSKRVWLKSGGYLVIEPTEALTVIDVNTGKYSGKKNKRDTIMKINLEAAREIGRQLRLRNLSGIIIIDFIDMDEKEDQRLLLDEMEGILYSDPVKTSLVDMTRLNLVEITRKKIRRPLYEQAANKKEKAEQ